MLPILRNAVVGLQGVDAHLLESAKGMGMSEPASLLRIRIPLAWPVILAGIRVSAQMSMGIAAIAAYVLGPGLGSRHLHRAVPGRRLQERPQLRAQPAPSASSSSPSSSTCCCSCSAG